MERDVEQCQVYPLATVVAMVTDPDRWREGGWDYENIQVQMQYEIALQLERIADALEEANEG